MRTFITLTLLTFGLIGCSSESPAPPPDNPATVPADDMAADETLYRLAAEKMVAELQTSLKSALMKAMAERGPVGALLACQTQAPEIAAMNAAGGWSVKRVSDKNRNPNNRADSLEMTFLTAFTDTSETAPSFLIDWSEPDSTGERTFRYFKQIRTKQFCLKCHGGLQTLAPGIVKALRRHYPADKATGYREGDLRGMFVVESIWPGGKPYAEHLLADTAAIPPVTDSASVDSAAID